jgi:RNA polymerase sigma factor (sigma-70 family)
MKRTDEHIVKQYQKGSKHAAKQLMNRYRPLIYKLTGSTCPSLSREDMKQTLWAEFFALARDYDSRKKVPFSCYIFHKLKGRQMTLGRKELNRINRETAWNPELETRQSSPPPAVGHGDIRQKIKKLPLTIEQKKLIFLLYLGHTQKEIADKLNITRAAVSQRMKRIRKKLLKLKEFEKMIIE